jgi:hypothetical protein
MLVQASLFPAALDTTSIDLFSGQQTFTVSGEGFHRFVFTNNLPNKVRVLSVYLEKGYPFYISRMVPDSLPAVLEAGQKIMVMVYVGSDSGKTTSDDLIIITENAATTSRFTIALAGSSVSTLPAEKLDLKLIPNPTTDYLDITVVGATNGTAEIYDLLGNLLYRSEVANFIVRWNGKNISGEHVSPGTYYVRFVGSNTSRAITKKFMMY